MKRIEREMHINGWSMNTGLRDVAERLVVVQCPRNHRWPVLMFRENGIWYLYEASAVWCPACQARMVED